MQTAMHYRLWTNKSQALYQMVEHHVGNRAYQNQGKRHDKQKFTEWLAKKKHPDKHSDQRIDIDFSE